MKTVVSACLLGENCKYNGGNNYNEKVVRFLDGKEIIKICPEVLAGLGTPRIPIEIVNGRVVRRDGVDVDEPIRRAVDEILASLDGEEIECVILKSRSPTCGVKEVYDGTFSGILREGMGTLAEALSKAGYRVIDCEDI